MGEATASQNSSTTAATLQTFTTRPTCSRKRLRANTSVDMITASAEEGSAINTCQCMIVVGERANAISAAQKYSDVLLQPPARARRYTYGPKRQQEPLPEKAPLQPPADDHAHLCEERERARQRPQHRVQCHTERGDEVEVLHLAGQAQTGDLHPVENPAKHGKHEQQAAQRKTLAARHQLRLMSEGEHPGHEAGNAEDHTERRARPVH